jgi:hypothetical protein
MLLVGCRPPGRFTEQHDMFFGIAETPAGLIPKLNSFWPEARGRLHVDAFYKHTGFKGAPSHIDDKWGVDVDDVYEIEDILPPSDREQFSVHIAPATPAAADPLLLGYITFDKLAGYDL